MQNHPYQPTRRRFPLIPLLLIGAILGFGIAFIPRALDQTPPVLAVEGIEATGRYGGEVTITILGQDEGRGLGTARILLDGEPIALFKLSGKQGEAEYHWDTHQLPGDGVHLIEIELTDDSLWHHRVSQAFDLIVDNTPPDGNLLVRPADPVQGQAFAIFVRADEPLKEAEGTFLGQTLQFYGRRRQLRALVGIPHNAPSGNATAEVRVTDRAGNVQELTTAWTVQKGQFKTGVVQLPKSKRTLLTDQEKKTVNREKRAEALRQSGADKLWKGTFTKPADGITTSTFAARRVYNNRVVRSVHLGWDIANREGTPVVAGNDGIVALAEKLPIHGNNILIDHGQGVFSGYAHLSAILVQVGEKVSKGQLIARVGTTGQSTGPHLHWEMFVHGIPVDPKPWLTESYESP